MHVAYPKASDIVPPFPLMVAAGGDQDSGGEEAAGRFAARGPGLGYDGEAGAG